MAEGSAEARAQGTDGKDRRPLGWNVFLKVIIFLVVVFAVALLMYHFAYGPMSWGGEGDLELTILLDGPSMPLNGSLTGNYTLSNTGDTDLRVLLPRFPSLTMFTSNNTTVPWVGPVNAPPPPDTNDDLITIRAGESRSWEILISSSRWDLRANETYRVLARYTSWEEGRVTLPYWKGELMLNEVHFSVDP